MQSRSISTFLILCAVAGAAACDSGSNTEPSSSSSSSGAGGQGGAGGEDGAGGAGGVPVDCSDEVILGLDMQNDIAPGKVESEPDGSGFRSTVDARAGGAFAEDPDSYVYGRFTEAGLEKVEISDEDSLDSMDWHIAFRRYVVRINSGDSGPGSVTAARIPGMVDYDALTTVPADLKFRTDDYFTSSCELIPDGSGLENSPATALSSFWTYPGCVQMTDNVYVLEVPGAKRLKFTVSSYYSETAQEECDTTDKTSGAGSAIYRVRWAFLQ